MVPANITPSVCPVIGARGGISGILRGDSTQINAVNIVEYNMSFKVLFISYLTSIINIFKVPFVNLLEKV